MSTVLIPTIPADAHAAAVALVLEEMGHRPLRWFCQDLPEFGTASFFIGKESQRVPVRDGAGAPMEIQDVDVFWHRRVGEPVIRNFNVQASDRKVAFREAKRFQRGLIRSLSDRIFSVNDYSAALNAENKIPQLQAAKAVGFDLPETLVSNDPGHIKAFLRQHQDQGTVFKMFESITWDEPETLATVYTHQVTLADLPSDRMLQLSPAIFQAYVPKAFELRVTCMGDQQFAVRLDSQGTREGEIDWRLEPIESLPMAPVDLPEDVAQRCRALMRRLGLVFGCFDFIVTPSGEYVFLEINQMGQFLWIEERLPELPLLQAFCEFLVSRDANFRHRASTPHRFPFAAMRAAARAMVDLDLTLHVGSLETSKVVRG